MISIIENILGKRRFFLAFQWCIYKQILSLVSNFKGRATNVAEHVSKKARSESILYLRLVLTNPCYRLHCYYNIQTFRFYFVEWRFIVDRAYNVFTTLITNVASMLLMFAKLIQRFYNVYNVGVSNIDIIWVEI